MKQRQTQSFEFAFQHEVPTGNLPIKEHAPMPAVQGLLDWASTGNTTLDASVAQDVPLNVISPELFTDGYLSSFRDLDT